MEQKKQRIELLDALRGGALIVMIVHHFLYDLVVFCGAPWSWFSNPVWFVLHYLDAGLFILLAGVSSDFSHSNPKRALKTLAAALAVSLVTAIMDMPVVFGVLHLLGTCMLLYGLTQRFWQTLNDRAPWFTPALCALGVLAFAPLTEGYPTTTPHLWMFGLVTPDFSSSDYFPLLPWVFVFLFGTWAGRYIRAGRLPGWFYEARQPRLAAIGRRSMLVYLAHQPVLYALVQLGLLLYKGR